MGYRSDVAAVFYVSKAEHLPLLKLWLSENFPIKEFDENIRWFDRGIVFECPDVKWYDSFPDVKAFIKAAEDYKELVDEFDESPVEGQPAFCFEFMRVGENYDDVDSETCGDHSEFLLDLKRTITVEV